VLTAPKVIVSSGESANMQVRGSFPYFDFDDEVKYFDTGVALDLLPILQNDDKEILLKGYALFSGFLDTKIQQHNGKEYEIPYLEITNIPIHTMVGDQQTILIIGPKIRPNITKREDTVLKEKQRLLILIKPTVVIKSD